MDTDRFSQMEQNHGARDSFFDEAPRDQFKMPKGLKTRRAIQDIINKRFEGDANNLNMALSDYEN